MEDLSNILEGIAQEIGAKTLAITTSLCLIVVWICCVGLPLLDGCTNIVILVALSGIPTALTILWAYAMYLAFGKYGRGK